MGAARKPGPRRSLEQRDKRGAKQGDDPNDIATADMAVGCPAICAFANDKLDATIISLPAKGGTRLERLTTFPDVLITGHQGFLTREAPRQIAEITMANISSFQIENPKPENVIRLAS